MRQRVKVESTLFNTRVSMKRKRYSNELKSKVALVRSKVVALLMRLPQSTVFMPARLTGGKEKP